MTLDDCKPGVWIKFSNKLMMNPWSWQITSIEGDKIKLFSEEFGAGLIYRSEIANWSVDPIRAVTAQFNKELEDLLNET